MQDIHTHAKLAPVLDLDEIESQFRASVKVKPVFERASVKSVLLVADRKGEELGKLLDRVKHFLRVLDSGREESGEEKVTWHALGSEEITSVRSMLEKEKTHNPDLVVTYRHLFEEEKELVYSLGTYVDMLTQVAKTPVLLIPNPDRETFVESTDNTDRVMVVTNHIVGDSRLVNWGLRFVMREGRLKLVHIEDDAAFERYIDIISRIPGIDTTRAEETIKRQLLHEAEDYLAAVAEGIEKTQSTIEVVRICRMGHAVSEYKALVDRREVDLVVFNTKDKDQVAMQGKAYSLAVELLGKPLLML